MRGFQLAAMGAAVLALAAADAANAQAPRVRVGGEAGVDVETGSDFYRASELVGMTVKDADGDSLGVVKDLLIDSRTEQVQYLLLEPSGIAELREKIIVVPWTVAEAHYVAVPDQRFITLHIARDRVLRAPAFAFTEFRTLRSPRWVTEVNQFFDVDIRERRGVLRPDLDDRRPGDRRPDDRRPGDRRPDDRRPDDRRPDDRRPDDRRPDDRRPDDRRPDATPDRRPDATPDRRPDATPDRRPGTEPPRRGDQPDAQPRTPRQPDSGATEKPRTPPREEAPAKQPQPKGGGADKPEQPRTPAPKNPAPQPKTP